MKFLKGLALFILGSLLSLSLMIFGPLLTINQTALSPDFVSAQVKNLDLPSLAEDIMVEQIPPGQEYMYRVVVDAVEATVADEEVWLKQQASIAIYTFYDYLEGESQHLSLEIPLDTLKESLRDNLWQEVLADPPFELQFLPPELLELEFNLFWDAFSEEIPSTLELDETMLDAEVMEQIELAKRIVGYVNIAFNVLIALALVLILLIILVYREVKGSTRHLGITFLVCGIPSLAFVFIARYLAETQLVHTGLSAYLQTLITQLIRDALTPLMIYGIALMATGLILLIVSFVYRRREEYSYY